ncbi:MAG: hypothetical protein JXQ90_09730 [Cyclobacteriaceae bacterium]
MKNFLTHFFIGILSIGLTVAQTPTGFGYQAIIRNANNDPITNQDVSLQVSILEASATGTAVYTETHSEQTNGFGLVDLVLGSGDPVRGSFNGIDWSSGAKFIEVALDDTGGSNFTVVGSKELLAVPYALHAASSSGNTQTLTKTGNTITLSGNGGSIEDAVNDADADSTNELQDLKLEGNILTITKNGNATAIDLTPFLNKDTKLTEAEVDEFTANNGYLTSYAESDGDSTNEIQDLSLTNNVLKVTNNAFASEIDLSVYKDNTDTQLTEAEVDAYANNNGYLTSFTEVDGDVTNEIQDLDLTDDILTVTNNNTATEIDLSVYKDNTDTQLTEAEVDAYADNNGYLIAEVDGDVTNEIQDLDLTDDILTVTNNSTATEIDLSIYKDNTDTQLTEAEVDAYTNNNGYLTSFTEVDGDVTNEIQDLDLTDDVLTVTNNTTATEIDLSIYKDNTDTQLTEAEVDAYANNNGYLTSFTEVDGDVTNEIQDLSLTDDILKVTGNNEATGIDLASYKELPASLGTTGQVLSVTANGIEWAAPSGGSSRVYATESGSSHTIPAGNSDYFLYFSNAYDSTLFSTFNCTVTLPDSPSAGDKVIIARQFGWNPFEGSSKRMLLSFGNSDITINGTPKSAYTNHFEVEIGNPQASFPNGTSHTINSIFLEYIGGTWILHRGDLIAN